MSTNIVGLTRALVYAAEAHANQQRRGSAQENENTSIASSDSVMLQGVAPCLKRVAEACIARSRRIPLG